MYISQKCLPTQIHKYESKLSTMDAYTVKTSERNKIQCQEKVTFFVLSSQNTRPVWAFTTIINSIPCVQENVPIRACIKAVWTFAKCNVRTPIRALKVRKGIALFMLVLLL